MKDKIKLIVSSIIIGIFAGVFANFYRFLVGMIEKLLTEEYLQFIGNNFFIVIFIIQSIILAIISARLSMFEPLAGGSGIPQVKAELMRKIDPNPFKVIFVKIVGGASAILAGLSVGREGPSIQMGAMGAKIISRNESEEDKNILLEAGAAAGLSAAFQAPIAAVVFIFEELGGRLSEKIIISGLSATVAASLFSYMFFGTNPVFSFGAIEFDIFRELPFILLFGVFLSAFGLLYLYLIKKFFKLQKNSPPGLLKFIPTFLASVSAFAFIPMIMGGGGFLLDFSLKNHTEITVLIALLIIKLLFSLLSFTSGVSGGIFFPILIMGALAGMIFTGVFNLENEFLYIVLGMSGLLCAIVRGPVTSILLLFEMTGSFNSLMPLGVVALITYFIPEIFNSAPVYDYLTERLLEKN